jgi:ribonuclease P protein component
MEENQSHSLGKSERLKSRKQIDMLFKNGKKITHLPFRLLYKIENGKEKVKAGFTVSSKNFPRAVDRNRIKRLCRESYRVNNQELKSIFSANHRQAFLFFIYTGREILTYENISRSVKQILDKLVRTTREENVENS